RGGVVVRLASAIEADWLLDVCAADLAERRDVGFNRETERVEVVSRLAYEGLVLDETRERDPRGPDVERALAEAALAAGPAAFAYVPGQPPSLASQLQDFFGMRDGPRVGDGGVPLVLHLLAPNARDVQVTTDLAGFWDRHYPALRKELMRRYPKHAWPEDPR